jgi:hypothetical protein
MQKRSPYWPVLFRDIFLYYASSGALSAIVETFNVFEDGF